MKYRYIQNARSNAQIEPQIMDKIIAELKKRRIYSEIIKFNSEKDLVDTLESINKTAINTLVLIGDDVDFDIFIGQISKVNEDVAIGFIPLSRSRITSKTGISTWQNGVEAMAQRKISEKTIYSISSRFFFDEIILNFHNENAENQSKVQIKTDSGLELTAPSAEFKFENLNEDQFLSKSPIQVTAYHQNADLQEAKKKSLISNIIDRLKKTTSQITPESLIMSIHSKNFKIMFDGEIKDSLNRKYKNNLSIGRTSRAIRLITKKSQQIKDQD